MEAARTRAAMPVTETLTMLKNGRWGELCMYFDRCLAQNTLDLQRSGALCPTITDAERQLKQEWQSSNLWVFCLSSDGVMQDVRP